MLILISILPLLLVAAPLVYTEKNLVELASKSSPKLSEIKSQLLNTQSEALTLTEKYAPELYGRGSYSETQERPVIQFLPVFSPIKQAQLGVRKKFSKGFDAQFQLTTDQRSASSPFSGQYKDVTTNIVSLTVQMDLWKDLFGSISEAELNRSDLSFKRGKIEDEISQKALRYSVRRTYWSLVANNEQMKVASRLLEDSKAQLADSRQRLNKSVGDAGDVARYEAQVANRKGQVIYFTYQRGILIKTLKNLIPDLLDKTINEVNACAFVILTAQKVPWEFTKYDEVLNFHREMKQLDKHINNKYSDVDVKLFGTLRSTGVGSDQLGASNYRGSYGRAFNDMQNNNRAGYEVGINVAIPLGSAKENTKKSKTLYDEERAKAAIDNTHALIVSTHQELSKSIGLIGEVIETQKASTEALKRRVSSVRLKYQQARASVNDLLLDQDALTNSELSTIEAQLQALNVLIDYLMVFTDTPCDFNRI
jgi:outer membrane protein TolC